LLKKGVRERVQDYFSISDSESGLLQTAFICSYMLVAPLFGYLGDRYSRKWLIIFGISFWSVTSLAGSFVPKDWFILFGIIRGLVGVGEASYSCVAPTMIGDLFTGHTRTHMLALFYLALPVGGGLGYIISDKVATFCNDWRWSFRVTPPIGVVCILLLIFVVNEPERGSAESQDNGHNHHHTHQHEDFNKDIKWYKSFYEDTIYLLKNRSFVWTTLGFTFATFLFGGISYWYPSFVKFAIKSKDPSNNGEEYVLFMFCCCCCFLFMMI
jgi:MFS transporter, Spinster family, sphingosine-1-phosphate transporter